MLIETQSVAALAICASLPALPWQRRRATGFSLIELMITVAIIAILAAIAYPSYRNYVLRGKLVNATNGLAALQANMERYYQDNRTYDSVVVTAATPTAFTSPCRVAATLLKVGDFQLSCSVAPTANVYTLQAQGNVAPVAGFTYTVDQSNVQSTAITGTKGWNTPVGAPFACWVIKEGPLC